MSSLPIVDPRSTRVSLFSPVETVMADEPTVRSVIPEHGLYIGATHAVLAVGVVLD
jgi:hypothetical protein